MKNLLTDQGFFHAFLFFQSRKLWCEGSRASCQSLLTYVVLQGGVSGQVPEQWDRCPLHRGVADVQHSSDAWQPICLLNNSPGHCERHLWKGTSVSLPRVQSLRKSHTQPALCSSLSIFKIVLSQSYIWVATGKGGDKKEVASLLSPRCSLVSSSDRHH